MDGYDSDGLLLMMDDDLFWREDEGSETDV